MSCNITSLLYIIISGGECVGHNLSRELDHHNILKLKIIMAMMTIFFIIISHFICMCGIILQTNLVSRMINIRSNKKWKKKISQNVLGAAAEN